MPLLHALRLYFLNNKFQQPFLSHVDAKQHKFLYNQPLATVVSMSHTIYHATCKSYAQHEDLNRDNTSNGIREMHITAVVALHGKQGEKNTVISFRKLNSVDQKKFNQPVSFHGFTSRPMPFNSVEFNE
jgi:hypothetical protein